MFSGLPSPDFTFKGSADLVCEKNGDGDADVVSSAANSTNGTTTLPPGFPSAVSKSATARGVIGFAHCSGGVLSDTVGRG